MSLLQVRELSQCFIEKSLYKNASFDLFKGEHIGVVGQNGAGKSTLIKILLGEVIPDKGDIKWQPNIKIGHLDQHAEIDKNMTILEYLQTAFEGAFIVVSHDFDFLKRVTTGICDIEFGTIKKYYGKYSEILK